MLDLRHFLIYKSLYQSDGLLSLPKLHPKNHPSALRLYFFNDPHPPTPKSIISGRRVFKLLAPNCMFPKGVIFFVLEFFF